MNTFYGSENKEIQGLMTLGSIDYYKVKIFKKNLKGKHFSIYAKHIWDGRISRLDTLINTFDFFNGKSIIESDTLSFTVFGNKSSNDKLNVLFSFEQFENQRKYSATQSDDYYLTDIGPRLKERLELNRAFPIFAYILPYVTENGFKSWCTIDNSGADIDIWGSKFGIKHYLVFEMKIE
jgi:hypothetical protein